MVGQGKGKGRVAAALRSTRKKADGEATPTDSDKSAMEDENTLNESGEGDESAVKNNGTEVKHPENTEMVSDEDDEDFGEKAKTLDTEEVSDDDLPENARADMPETEPLSEDELLEENKKRRKRHVAEAEAVSEDELPDDNKKFKRAKVEEAEAVSDDELPEDGKKGKKGVKKTSDPERKSSDDEKNGKDDEESDDFDSKKTKDGKKIHPELEKYWKAVKEDPADFTAWTYLLMYVDQENEAEVAREAYDAFLAQYPYCYGYWRKYADYEKRKGNITECEQVFERGLKAIPLSVDLWLHYLNYCKASKEDEGEDFIRSQYERAIDVCGLEFRSDRLWESYIKWEKEKKNLTNVTALFDKLLAIPTQGYTTHFDNFQEHVNSNVPQTILPVDDFLSLRKEVIDSLKEQENSAGVAPTATDSDAPPGDDEQVNTPTDGPLSLSMEEETNALRAKIIATRRKVHKATVAAVAARWNFEEGIKRPYFHVKPLERCQLKNWKEYLDFEIDQGSEKRIIILFERCLIACALYEEFWLRFIKHLETKPDGREELIRDVYERACSIHHRKKPYLHLQWAAFEENAGNVEKAASILEELDNNIPNMLQVMYRRINVERRRQNFDRVIELFEEYIASSKSKSVAASLSIKYARFTWKWLKNVPKAISILELALEKDKDNPRLHLQLIDMNMQKDPADENAILRVFDDFLSKDAADLEHKILFTQRKIEFLEDFGSHIASVQKAQNDLQKYLKQLKDKKKRTAEAATSDHSHSSRKRHETSQHAVGSSTGSQQSFPPSGYGNYYQQYPQQPTQDGTTQSFQGYPPGYPVNYGSWSQYPQGPQYHGQSYGQPSWPAGSTGYYPNY